MPLRVQGYTYTLLPSRFPALFRPLARFFFGKAKEGLVDPQLTENIAMVCHLLFPVPRYQLRILSTNSGRPDK